MSKTINRRSPIFLSFVMFAFVALTHNIVNAQNIYPSKPIRLIAPVSAGGGLDNIARAVAELLSKGLGQTVIVDNLSGGGGAIASQTTAKAAPDGYTLMIAYVGTHGTNPAVRKLNYDALKDFTHISMIGGSPNVLVTSSPLSHISSLENLFTYLKSLNRPITYGSAGPGTSSHLLVEQIDRKSTRLNSSHTDISRMPSSA